jgi:hypothetical protein
MSGGLRGGEIGPLLRFGALTHFQSSHSPCANFNCPWNMLSWEASWMKRSASVRPASVSDG